MTTSTPETQTVNNNYAEYVARQEEAPADIETARVRGWGYFLKTVWPVLSGNYCHRPRTKKWTPFWLVLLLVLFLFPPLPLMFPFCLPPSPPLVLELIWWSWEVQGGENQAEHPDSWQLTLSSSPSCVISTLLSYYLVGALWGCGASGSIVSMMIKCQTRATIWPWRIE